MSEATIRELDDTVDATIFLLPRVRNHGSGTKLPRGGVVE